MAGHYHRTQILLDPEQFRRLAALARREGRSISSLTREFVQAGLKAYRREQQRRTAALGRLTERRGVLAERHGVYGGDPVGEAREERESEIDTTVGGR